MALLKDESLFYHLIHLSPRCTVRINDPMHVRFLLFCVCWVWYYTYFVEYYLDTYAMLLVCSIVPCPAVSRVFYGIWMFHPSILRSLSCWISLSSVIFDGTYIHLCIDKKEFMHIFFPLISVLSKPFQLTCGINKSSHLAPWPDPKHQPLSSMTRHRQQPLSSNHLAPWPDPQHQPLSSTTRHRQQPLSSNHYLWLY